MKAYCVKCKEKCKISNPEATFTSGGTPATRGVCPECGTTLFRMGRTDAHEGLEPPKNIIRTSKKKKSRNGKLVIVESPAKAKTVGRYLGKEYTVEASVGHVRDLLKSQLSVDVENDYAPKYRVPKDKRGVVKKINQLAGTAKEVYLATDPDREGEAIAWHLIEAAKIDPDLTKRVVFHEITKSAIEDAFSKPREINMDLVDAQQARRILDRLVGYSLSPILWRKVRGRLSAGRVQSVALRLIVDREREIGSFVPEEYWTIAAEFKPEGEEATFIAKLLKLDGGEPELSKEDHVSPILEDMEIAKYTITRIKRGERRRKPSPPFITSTLQQEASRRLGFSTKRTMSIAQQLYEGVDLGGDGNTGLITYMRTDSTSVSKQAQTQARDYVRQKYGSKYIPEAPREFRTKVRLAQEAHEAIRPTSVLRKPKTVRKVLKRDQYRLYSLIWQRFIASQMSSAIYDTVSVNVTGKSQTHEYLLRATGAKIKFPGFLVVYEESKSEGQSQNGDEIQIPLDLIKEGQPQQLVRLIPEQHFTQPPSRFTEASLVRALEENAIGRPSTYAPIIGTLQQRGYVIRDNKRLVPTETGEIVNDLLADYFPNILDVGFTARMEQDLDRIASGEQPWVEIVQEFYSPFSKQVAHAKDVMPEVKVEPELVGRNCPESGHELIVRWGRYGKFISCSGFPECRYTEPWLEAIGVKCPKDGGEVVERRTKRGRVFYGCSNYPDCDFTSWKRPLSNPCPNCGEMLVIANKNHAQCISCERRFELQEIQPLQVTE